MRFPGARAQQKWTPVLRPGARKLQNPAYFKPYRGTRDNMRLILSSFPV
jgi:hypothetical protein